MYYFFIILESLGSLKRTVKTFKREIDSAILMYRSKDDHIKFTRIKCLYNFFQQSHIQKTSLSKMMSMGLLLVVFF